MSKHKSSASEPSITYNSERRLSFALPDMSVPGHFSAVNADLEHENELRSTHSHLANSNVKLDGKRKQVVEDVLEVRSICLHYGRFSSYISQLFCSRPTLEIFERSWRKDAVFEVSISFRDMGLHSTALPF